MTNIARITIVKFADVFTSCASKLHELDSETELLERLEIWMTLIGGINPVVIQKKQTVYFRKK